MEIACLFVLVYCCWWVDDDDDEEEQCHRWISSIDESFHKLYFERFSPFRLPIILFLIFLFIHKINFGYDLKPEQE